MIEGRWATCPYRGQNVSLRISDCRLNLAISPYVACLFSRQDARYLIRRERSAGKSEGNGRVYYFILCIYVLRKKKNT